MRAGPRALGLGRERTRRDLVRLERGAQRGEQLHREPGADLARVHQLALVVITDEQRTDVRARAFGIGVAADHELLAQEALGLHPPRIAAGRVRGVTPLGHDAFEASLARELEELPAVTDHVIRIADRARLAAQLLQATLALLER